MKPFLSLANLAASSPTWTALGDPLLFWGAFGFFATAASIQLALRVHGLRAHKQHRAVSERMEKALQFIRTQKHTSDITLVSYQKYTGAGRAAALRDLQKLVELGLLKPPSKTGKTYTLVVRKIAVTRKNARTGQKPSRKPASRIASVPTKLPA